MPTAVGGGLGITIDHLMGSAGSPRERGRNTVCAAMGRLCPFLCPLWTYLGAESVHRACQDLLQIRIIYKDLRDGEVAEWLKATVC